MVVIGEGRSWVAVESVMTKMENRLLF
jgi:hypothetical protein